MLHAATSQGRLTGGGDSAGTGMMIPRNNPGTEGLCSSELGAGAKPRVSITPEVLGRQQHSRFLPISSCKVTTGHQLGPGHPIGVSPATLHLTSLPGTPKAQCPQLAPEGQVPLHEGKEVKTPCWGT